MKKIFLFFEKNYVEIIFQLILHFMLFLFYSSNQDDKEGFAFYKVVFFLSYALAAFVINYVLLPKFYYKKKIAAFFLLVILTISVTIINDEFVLEKIYFPNTRGNVFPGVAYTLLEILPVILILVSFKFGRDFNIKQSEVDALKSLVKDSELQFLKSQINPHFLFNNLNNLYAYATENSPKTPSIILELSSVLRYMLYDCKENYVPLSKEITHLKHFTGLNELQIENRGKIEFISNVYSNDFLIAPLILNVFIENAFKHSTASQSENISVNININVDDKGVLNFSCINSFLPIHNTQNLAKGIGLINVKKRLELIYPNQHNLDIINKNNSFTILLKIQLKTTD